jgi:hypothetical protein
MIKAAFVAKLPTESRAEIIAVPGATRSGLSTPSMRGPKLLNGAKFPGATEPLKLYPAF